VSAPPPTAAETPAAPRRKGQRTRERILDAAEAVFAERGYDGASLREVAGRVGIQSPSLYNHFPNKESLYAAVLERGVGPLLDLLSGFVVDDDAGVDSERLIEAVMALLARRPSLPRLVLHETLAGGQRLTPILSAWIVPVFARAREMIEVRPSARSWRREQIPLLVLALYHVVVGYFSIAPLYQQLNGEDLLSEPARARQTRFLAEMVRRLLGAPAAPNTTLE
jgi:AcrR family transcriptional regulator